MTAETSVPTMPRAGEVHAAPAPSTLISLWRAEDAPPVLRALIPQRDTKWIIHCPKTLADQFGEDVPAFLNGKLQEGNWRNFILGLGFADYHDHPTGDGFVITYTES